MCEIPVNLPDIPVPLPSLPTRCRTHADNMQSEGWYTTANVLAEAADLIEKIPADLAKILSEAEMWDQPLDATGMRHHLRDLITGYFNGKLG